MAVIAEVTLRGITQGAVRRRPEGDAAGWSARRTEGWRT